MAALFSGGRPADEGAPVKLTSLGSERGLATRAQTGEGEKSRSLGKDHVRPLKNNART